MSSLSCLSALIVIIIIIIAISISVSASYSLSSLSFLPGLIEYLVVTVTLLYLPRSCVYSSSWNVFVPCRAIQTRYNWSEMSYSARIIKAITELKERGEGSSSIAIENVLEKLGVSVFHIQLHLCLVHVSNIHVPRTCPCRNRSWFKEECRVIPWVRIGI